MQIATSLYIACTDFILAMTHLLHISYRDANALLFFIVWPAVTLALLATVIVQGVQLVREPRGTDERA